MKLLGNDGLAGKVNKGLDSLLGSPSMAFMAANNTGGNPFQAYSQAKFNKGQQQARQGGIQNLLGQLDPNDPRVALLQGDVAMQDAAIGQLTSSPTDAPSSVREWEYYNSLSDEEKKQYLNMKRASQYRDFGSYQAPINPLTNKPDMGGATSNTLPPENTPENKAAIVAAQEAAKTEAAREAATQSQAKKIPAVDALRTSLDGADFDKIYGREERFYPDWARSQEGVDMKSNINQLVGLLKLGARGELKGQGTISDFESKMLGDAATQLENNLISPQAAKRAYQQAIEVLYKSAGQQSVTSLEVGTVEDGYEYMGGDPSKESSWRQVR